MTSKKTMPHFSFIRPDICTYSVVKNCPPYQQVIRCKYLNGSKSLDIQTFRNVSFSNIEINL